MTVFKQGYPASSECFCIWACNAASVHNSAAYSIDTDAKVIRDHFVCFCFGFPKQYPGTVNDLCLAGSDFVKGFAYYNSTHGMPEFMPMQVNSKKKQKRACHFTPHISTDSITLIAQGMLY